MKINIYTSKQSVFTIVGDLENVRRDVENSASKRQFLQYKNELGHICLINAATVDMIEATEDYVKTEIKLPTVPVPKKETYTQEQLEAQPLLAVYGGRVLDEKSGI